MWPSCSTSYLQRSVDRILSGSDFPINLLDVDSYNEHLQEFGGTPHLTDSDKDLFCSVNPETFLFHNG